MSHSRDFYALPQRRPQLLAQLPRQRRFRLLTRFYLSARKLLFQRRRIGTAPLTDQQPPIRPLNHRRHHNFDQAVLLKTLPPRSSFGVAQFARKIRHNSFAPATSGGPGVFNNSSRTTNTRRSRIAGTSFHSTTPYACFARDLSPTAAHANTITSGAARATSSSLTRAPAGTTISPPHNSTNSATQGGELIRGFGHASQ